MVQRETDANGRLRKTYVPEGESVPASQIAATIEALSATIANRWDADESSYTFRLLTGKVDEPLKKVAEEANEVGLAAKDADVARYFAREAEEIGADEQQIATLKAAAEASVDHLRYEAADVMYHLLVVLERFGITLDEFAAELNNRMTDEERPEGAIRLFDECVKRGK